VPLKGKSSPIEDQTKASSVSQLVAGNLDATEAWPYFELTDIYVQNPEPQLASWWFASPETWLIDHAPDEARMRLRSASDRSLATATVHRWLAQWVSGGSNPFIHQQLYLHRFPQCIQDAYLVLSCYLNKRPGNERAVLQITQDKAHQLVTQETALTGPMSGCVSLNGDDLDPLAHLARAQALLIYQMLGLFDGDVSLRSMAERHIPVLRKWMCEAVNHASKCDSLGGFLSSLSYQTSAPKGLSDEKIIWYSWILAESLRRTWLVVSAIQGVYLSSQEGVDRCLGGMMFTSRQGFWEAPSALTWQKRCSNFYSGLVRLTETEKLLTLVAAKELDEFARTMLEITFGVEQLEKWGVETTNEIL